MQCAQAPIDLECLCRRVAHESTVAASRPADVVVLTTGDLGGAVGDESLIRHILSNLISNAVKYSPPGRPVQLEVARSGANALLAVADHGIGISAADQPRIFEGFFRGTNVGTTGGSGIGLSIVRRCVELHRGAIQFESREGEGSRFEVRLPLFEPPMPAPAGGACSAPSALDAMGIPGSGHPSPTPR